MNQLRKKRGEVRGLIAFGAIALLVQTGLILHALTVQRVMDVQMEWGALLMLGVGWATLVVIAAQFRRHMLAFPDPGESMAARLRALIDENRTAMRRMRFMALAGLLFVAATGLTLAQLHEVDKMSLSNIRDFSILFGGGFLIGAAYGVWRYFRTLKPEDERLRRLLAQYGE